MESLARLSEIYINHNGVQFCRVPSREKTMRTFFYYAAFARYLPSLFFFLTDNISNKINIIRDVDVRMFALVGGVDYCGYPHQVNEFPMQSA